MSRAIIWFRNDQRLSDHAALVSACAEHEHVLPVLVHDPRQAGPSPFGFDRRGPFRERFWREGLADLDAQLRAKGSALLVRVGDPADVLVDVARKWNAAVVYAHRHFAWEELEHERQVAECLELRLFDGDTLLHAPDLPFAIAELPRMFTAFRQKVEQRVAVRAPLPEPSRIASPAGWNKQPRAGSTDPLDAPPLDPRAVMRFQGGRIAGLVRLAHYTGATAPLKHYKETRNALLGADKSAKLSPWLASGAISAREVHAGVRRFEQEHGANESTYWMVFELLWRDFFRFTATKHGRELFMKRGIAHRPVTGRIDHARFNLWCEGRTGQPFIDANMMELRTTGWMSNRGRQNVASYLVHDLGVDWRMGAWWFERMLLDYDPYSNWGNWQYVAGVGNDPREGRRFDPIRQAGMYDADGNYVRQWS